MANTYTKIYIHIVFAVKNNRSLISPLIRERVYKYMTGATNSMGHNLLAIGGIENHIHLLVEMNPTQSISDYVRQLKITTTKMINENHLIPFKFSWQRGFACFSYSPSQTETVKNYINNQYEHHKNVTFTEELKNTLDKFGVKYDDEYLMAEV